MEFGVNPTGALRLMRDLEGSPALVRAEVYQAMAESVLVVEAEVRRRTPVDTGRLRRSVNGRVELVRDDYVKGTLVVGMPSYNRYVEEGTKPHIIVPIRKKALRFESGGKVIFARRVRHPGTRGRFMVRNGVEAARPQVEAAFEYAAGKIAEAIGRGALP